MELMTHFKVTARCRLLDQEIKESYNDKDLILEMDMSDATHFLFKFAPNLFKMSNGWNVILKFSSNPENNLIAMILTDDDAEEKYIVLNPQSLWAEILLGYQQISILNNISTVLYDKEDE